MKTSDIIKLPVLAAILFFFLPSCNYKPKTENGETPLIFSLVERGCSYLKISARPANERVYYTYHIFLKDDYDKAGLTDDEFMHKTIDSLVSIYNYMRDITDPGRTDEYYGSFADFALYYAESQKTFPGLESGKEYILLGFCVNRDNNQPIGRLNTAVFKTLSMEETQKSDMKFDFMILDVIDDDTNETRVYCRPTTEAGVISKGIYASGYIYPLDSLKRNYGGDIAGYIKEYLDRFTKEGMVDFTLYRDIHEDVYLRSLPLLQEGKQYVVWATPYSADYLEKYQTLTFTYTEGIRINYSHDSK